MEIVSLGKECGVAKPEVEVLEAKTQDAATEKHVPYVEERENGYLVKVGKEAKHPMLEAHYIEFIELIIDGDKLYRKYLNPGDEPEAFFEIEAKTQDAATEKHVPYVEERENGYLVKVGKEAKHPMLEAHYIEFIELIIDGDKLYRKYLNPGDEPEAFFEIAKGKDVVAREYCNIHGLWKNR